MAEVDIKINMQFMALLGLAMFAVGLVLYVLSDRIVRGHLLLPLPPLAVAAYIYVVNWYATTDMATFSRADFIPKLKEVLIQTLIGGLAFSIVTFLMLLGLVVWRGATSGSSG